MKNNRFILIIVIFACLIIGSYYYFAKKDSSEKTNLDPTSELSQVMYKDLDNSYPSTPREVIGFYSRILMCYYNEEYTNDQFEILVEQARKLLDDELLDSNPIEKHVTNLTKEVEDYKSKKLTIISYTLDDSKDVVYFDYEGDKCAGIKSSYFMKRNSESFEKVYHQYFLRKDDNGRWKIYGFGAISMDDAQGKDE